MKIKIYQNDFRETSVLATEQSWQSLEHYLEKNQRQFVFNDAEQSVSVQVSDEIDAYLIAENFSLLKAELIDNVGNVSFLDFNKPKPQGRPRNMIFDTAIGIGMTMKQYAKHNKDQSLTKAAIEKKGILTKVELESGIKGGLISCVQIGTRQYINKVSLQEYINSKI